MGGGEREKIQEKKKKTIETSQGLSPWVLGRLVGRAFVCVCVLCSRAMEQREKQTRSHIRPQFCHGIPSFVSAASRFLRFSFIIVVQN